METLQSLLDKGEILEMEMFFKNYKDWNKDTLSAYLAVSIFRKEIEQGEKFSIFDYSMSLREVIDHIYRTKLLMRRFEFLDDVWAMKEAYQYFLDTGVSNTMLAYLMQNNLFYKKHFAKNLADISKLVEGPYSSRGYIFDQVEGQLQEESYEQ